MYHDVCDHEKNIFMCTMIVHIIRGNDPTYSSVINIQYFRVTSQTILIT